MLTRLVWRGILHFHAFIYRTTRGRAMGTIGGAPVLLLTTRGHKTGKEHTIALAYVEDNGDYVIAAEGGESPHHPPWYVNLEKKPTATVQIMDREIQVRAETATPEERERLWPRILEMSPGLEEYQTHAKHEFPVVILHEDAGGGSA